MQSFTTLGHSLLEEKQVTRKEKKETKKRKIMPNTTFRCNAQGQQTHFSWTNIQIYVHTVCLPLILSNKIIRYTKCTTVRQYGDYQVSQCWSKNYYQIEGFSNKILTDNYLVTQQIHKPSIYLFKYSI